MEADGSWWGPWSSKPVWGVKNVPGVFDSHTLPPSHYTRPAGFLGGTLASPEPRALRGVSDGRDSMKGTTMRGMRFLTVAVLAAVCLTATGCSTLTEKFKPAPKVVVLKARVASTDATLTGETLAPGRPRSLPLWPGSKVESSTQAQTPQGKSWTSAFTTTDDYEAVVKGFAVGLKDAGWSSEVADISTDTEKSSLLTASGESADALFTITRSTDSSSTRIDVVVTPK